MRDPIKDYQAYVFPTPFEATETGTRIMRFITSPEGMGLDVGAHASSDLDWSHLGKGRRLVSQSRSSRGGLGLALSPAISHPTTGSEEVRMRHGSHRSARISSLLLVTYLNACTSWQVQGVPPERVLQDPQYAQKGVRITTVDNRRLEILRPLLKGDTLVGQATDTVVAVPLLEIRDLAVRRPDTGRTFLLVLGLAAAAGAGLLILSLATLESQ
jgi:hypothetical protein